MNGPAPPDDADELGRDLARNRNRAAIRLASAAIVVAALGLLALSYIEYRDDQRARAADFNACGRVNVTRARVNANSAGIWLALRGAVQGGRVNPPTANIYRRIVASQSWQLLVPCDQAVDHPFVYFQPDLLPFNLARALEWSDNAKVRRLLLRYGRTVRDPRHP